ADVGIEPRKRSREVRLCANHPDRASLAAEGHALVQVAAAPEFLDAVDYGLSSRSDVLDAVGHLQLVKLAKQRRSKQDTKSRYAGEDPLIEFRASYQRVRVRYKDRPPVRGVVERLEVL